MCIVVRRAAQLMDLHTGSGNVRHPGSRQNNGGFTYLALLLVIVVMGVLLGAATEVWHTTMQREKERELLFVGNQFRLAIGAYYLNHRTLPHNLEDMLKDPQYAYTQRYLRKIYRDPMTGTKDWALLRGADGGILGVHSLSEMHPVKIAGFGVSGNSFDGAVKYSEWVFAYRARQNVTVPKPSFNSTGDKPLW
jgi:type II secretory pathway pseudopilin PulG